MYVMGSGSKSWNLFRANNSNDSSRYMQKDDSQNTNAVVMSPNPEKATTNLSTKKIAKELEKEAATPNTRSRTEVPIMVYLRPYLSELEISQACQQFKEATDGMLVNNYSRSSPVGDDPADDDTAEDAKHVHALANRDEVVAGADQIKLGHNCFRIKPLVVNPGRAGLVGRLHLSRVRIVDGDFALGQHVLPSLVGLKGQSYHKLSGVKVALNSIYHLFGLLHQLPHLL